MPDEVRKTPLPAALVLVVLGITACSGSDEHQPLDETAKLAAALRAELIAVPGGEFRMGDAFSGNSDEQPVRTVSVQPFLLSRVEVTAGQYVAYLRAIGSVVVAAGDSLPAANVSWNDAQGFIAWINAATGSRFRLPTEAEWEYAARAGTHTNYWWGNEYDVSMANGTGTAGRDTWTELAPIASFPANPFGLHDMQGNVWEWTADCYTETYGDVAVSDGSQSCGRVLRGGSWCDTPTWLRAATRNWFEQSERFDYVGFRLAHDAPVVSTAAMSEAS